MKPMSATCIGAWLRNFSFFLCCVGIISLAHAQESSPYGVSLGAVTRDPVLTPITIPLARNAGIAWLRITFGTGIINPSRGVLRFRETGYDALVDSARAQGLTILGMILGSSWMTSAPPPDSIPPGIDAGDYPPSDLNAWVQYVDTLVKHYRGKIQYWEVWNEPDLPGFWFGTPAQYAQLLAVTYNAIKQADPQATVLLGGLALGGVRVNPDFLPAILGDTRYPAGQYFDIMNIHSYKPKTQAKTTVDSVRALLAQYGAGGKPLWITETGYSSYPPHQSDPQYQGLEGQAQWLRDMLPFLLDTVRADKVFWFTLYDYPDSYDTTRDVKARYMGLIDKYGTPKQSYYAYRDLIQSRTTSVGENPEIPHGLILYQNYPNPFNPTTTIRFSLPQREHVTLKVFDVLGREVATLVDGELNPGKHSIVYNAEGLASGVYFYRLRAGSFVAQGKMEVVK